MQIIDTSISPLKSTKFADLSADELTAAVLKMVQEAYGKKPKASPISITRTASMNGITMGAKKETKLSQKKREAAEQKALTQPKYEGPSCRPTGATAATFIAAMLIAGKESAPYNENLTILNTAKEKLDQKAAVTSFCGYETTCQVLTHAQQTDAARWLARFLVEQQALKDNGTHQISEPVHTAHASQLRWTVAGFVAGLPNATRKLLGDLHARERLAQDEVNLFGELVNTCEKRTGLLATVEDTDWRAEKIEDLDLAFHNFLNRSYPITDGVDIGENVEKSIKMEKGKPVMDDAGKPVIIETIVPTYTRVKRRDSVGAAIANASDWDQKHTLLINLEGVAIERLESIRREIDDLEGSELSVVQIGRVHASMLQRGAPIEEERLVIFGEDGRS